MSALEDIQRELGIGEASASPAPVLFDRSPKKVPHKWTADVTVLTITEDARVDKWVASMLEYIEGRAASDLDTYLCVDTETCPETAVRSEHTRIAHEAQSVELHFKSFPMPQKIKDPEVRKQRDDAKRRVEEVRSKYDAFLASKYKRAGLSIIDGQVRLLQVYRPIEWDGETVKTCWVFDRWFLSPEAWLRLNEVLAHPRVYWVGHHVLFDMMMLEKSGIRPGNTPHCTMLQAHALKSDALSLALASLCEETLGKAMDKTQRRSEWDRPVLDQAQIEYAAGDVVATWELFNAQRLAVFERSVDPDVEDCATIYMLLQEALPAVCEMSTTGMGFDMDQFLKLRSEIEARFTSGQQRVIDAFTQATPPGAPKVVNPGSTAQLNAWAAACFPDSAKRAWPRTETGALQFGQDGLRYMLVRNVLPEDLQPPIRELADWAEDKKNWQTFQDFSRHAHEVEPGHFRMFGKIRIGGAETGRFSIQDPPLQTIKRDGEFRKMFKARPGHKMVVRDYGQIEVRVAAVLSEDRTLLYAIEHGLDVHTMTALACFSTEPTVHAFLTECYAKGLLTEGTSWTDAVQVKEVLAFFKSGPGKVFRQIAKIATFGLLYGQGATKLAWTLFAEAGLIRPVDECREIQKRLLAGYPGLKKWMQRTRNMSEADGKVWTPLGRRYSAGNQWYTKAINTPCQGGAAEIMLRALSYFPRAWGDLAGIAKLSMTVHDELIAEVPDEHVERADRIMGEVMQRAALDLFPKMPTHLLTEGGYGDNWYSAKGGH